MSTVIAPPIDEDNLIKSRPLTVEERPFKRISKRCLTLSTLPIPQLPPQNAPSNTSTNTTPLATPTTTYPSQAPPSLDIPILLHDIDLDFTHFHLTLTRLHFLHMTNQREILRYEAEKKRILEAAETARRDMAMLREQLEMARKEKQERLVYDAITEEILAPPNPSSGSHGHHHGSSTKLGTGTAGASGGPSGGTSLSRDEMHSVLARLRAEIQELEEEGQRYREVWRGRREVFDGVVARLEEMQGRIKEEKEEHERREGLDEEGEEGEVGEDDGKEIASTGGGAGLGRSTGGTPASLSVVQTPLRITSTVGSGSNNAGVGGGGRDVQMTDAAGSVSTTTSGVGGKGVEDADKMDTS